MKECKACILQYADKVKIKYVLASGPNGDIHMERLNSTLYICSYGEAVTYYMPKYCPECGRRINK